MEIFQFLFSVVSQTWECLRSGLSILTINSSFSSVQMSKLLPLSKAEPKHPIFVFNRPALITCHSTVIPQLLRTVLVIELLKSAYFFFLELQLFLQLNDGWQITR